MSMLAGAPWLLAHKSMLEVNKPKKYPFTAQTTSFGKTELVK